MALEIKEYVGNKPQKTKDQSEKKTASTTKKQLKKANMKGAKKKC